LWEEEGNLNIMLSYDDQAIQQVVWDVCEQHGIDPDVPAETLPLLRQLVEQFTGEPDVASFGTWLTGEIPRHFIALADRPQWIQGANWPWANGKPMIFAGQIDVDTAESAEAAKLFHDDTTFYLFIAPGADPMVIRQQY
jgi:hypothetical protein